MKLKKKRKQQQQPLVAVPSASKKKKKQKQQPGPSPPPPPVASSNDALQIVDAAAYAQLVLENQGRTLSVQDAAVELGRLRAIPLPPRAGEERV